MPPAEPMPQRLVEAVLARLQAIEAGAVYWYKPDEVLTDSIQFTDMKGSLAYAVLGGPEAPASEDNGDVHEGLLMTIKGWVKADDQLGRLTVLRRCIGDLRVAIATDESWGGLAIWTAAPAVQVTDPSELEKPFAHFELTFTIHYDRLRTAA
jgi:hypothetical protein